MPNRTDSNPVNRVEQNLISAKSNRISADSNPVSVEPNLISADVIHVGAESIYVSTFSGADPNPIGAKTELYWSRTNSCAS